MARRSRPRLVLGQDYVLDERGRAVFSREYLLSMGSCCGNGCLNCPYPTCPGNRRDAIEQPLRPTHAAGDEPGTSFRETGP